MKGISFTAEPGQKIAIVGSTGAGKTTLINLLLHMERAIQMDVLFLLERAMLLHK